MMEVGKAHLGLLARPLSPRSLVASLMLGMDPPRMAAADLVSWCGLFGVAPGTTRVALSRMVERGELLGSDARYELAGPLDERRSAQNEALIGTPPDWDGRWELYLVRPRARSAAERGALRRAMEQRHRVELRDGVWGRPANLCISTDRDVDRLVASQCDRWLGEPDAEIDVEVLFALPSWATRAHELVRALDRARSGLPDADAIPRGFYAAAATVDHVRRDPRLPEALVPTPWPGDELREHYRRFQHEFSEAVASWVRSQRHRDRARR